MAERALDPYLVDSLMPDLVGHDRRPASFLIYLFLYHRASQTDDWSVRLSHQAIASATGLSRSAAQNALDHLQGRQLIETTRAHPTAVPRHQVLRPWLRLRGET